MEEKKNVISLRDASITTMAVSIRVLQVGQKQMTLAVLKQLSREVIMGTTDFAGERFKLRGIPWGLVNYAYDMGGQQLVWQLGDELKRSPCGPSGESGWDRKYKYNSLARDNREDNYWHNVIMEFWKPFYGGLTQLFVSV